MTRSLLPTLASLALLCTGLAAQTGTRAPDGGTSTRVDGVELLAIPGKPLSGKSSIEWTRTMEDGSTVTLQGLANLARDNEGRMYRERRGWVPAGSGRVNPLNEMFFIDPVAKTRTVCTVQTKQCLINNYAPRTALISVPERPFVDASRSVSQESLGTESEEGMAVTGTRETVTLNAGVAGNSQPLVTTREFWYSAELETNLAVTRTDPRFGKQVVRLVDLQLGEPEAQTFALPKGYAVVDLRKARPVEK